MLLLRVQARGSAFVCSLSLSRSAEVSPGIVIVFLLFLLLQLGETATTLEFGVQGGPNHVGKLLCRSGTLTFLRIFRVVN